MNYKLISIDLAKNCLPSGAFNHNNTIVFNRKINRSALLNTLRLLVDNKNDANDAVAIGETAGRPKVSLLRPKAVEQQDFLIFHGIQGGFGSE